MRHEGWHVWVVIEMTGWQRRGYLMGDDWRLGVEAEAKTYFSKEKADAVAIALTLSLPGAEVQVTRCDAT